MRDELLGYYERELTFLRQMGVEFAEKYPKIAARLFLEAEKCDDPHVERMIEAFAFLAARVRLKLDDEFPEITESLLNLLTPHFLAPIPSMSIVQFALDPQRVNLQSGQTIPKDSMLYSSPVGGMACRFRTCYPVQIWPVEVTSARFDLPPPGGPFAGSARTSLRLELNSFSGAPFRKLREKISETEEHSLERLSFYLHGEGKLVHGLYELLLNDVVGIELRKAGERDAVPVSLPKDAVRPVGFEPDQGLLPYGNRSFFGYRLLQEFFTFPEKFFFFDLFGLDRVGENDVAIEVRFYFGREFTQEKNVNAQTFRLHATPVSNLFKQVAEPVRLTRLQHEYRVVPDVRRPNATEIYSIDAVTSTSPNLETTISYKPFYSFQHGSDRETQKTFWYASRRPSQRKEDEGTEVYVSLVDMAFNPSVPEVETIIVQSTCTNRDLPARLPFGSAEGDFQLEGPGVYSAIRCLVKPTASRRVPLRRGVQWRLLSHLALNYLSLVEHDGTGPQALQEILRLYDYADSSVTRQQIAGITHVDSRRVLRNVGGAHAAFVRGLEITLEFDESYYIGSGVYLMASILERFFALYSSVNSFSQLVVKTHQREGVLKRWLPRSGEQIVL